MLNPDDIRPKFANSMQDQQVPGQSYEVQKSEEEKSIRDEEWSEIAGVKLPDNEIDARVQRLTDKKQNDRANWTQQDQSALTRYIRMRSSRTWRKKQKEQKLLKSQMEEKDERVDREIEKMKFQIQTMKSMLEGTINREKLYIQREQQAILREKEAHDRQ